MATLIINPTETATPLPYDLQNVPDGYFDRAINPERLRDLKTGSRDMFAIPPSMILVEEGHNPRNYALPENRDHLDELKRSITQHGVLNPLWVRFDTPAPGAKKTAILVDGECRLRAVLELIEDGVEIRSVPVIQVEGKSETERLLLAITANTGKPLSKWELGEAFRRLVRFGWSDAEVSKKTGYTCRFVNEAVELADAPEDVKMLLSQQAVTPSLALATLREKGSDASAVLKAAVSVAKANGSGTAKRAKAPAASKAGQDKPESVSAHVLYAAEAMATALDRWREDATAPAETALIAAHDAYRKLIRAPKQGEGA